MARKPSRRRHARRLQRQEPDFRTVTLTRRVAVEMTETLEAQHRLHFVVKWTPQRPLVLMSLQVKIGGLFTELLTNPVSDNDGEITFDMGLFSAGDLTIRFSIGALMKIPKAATFIVENEQKVTPFKPLTGTKKLDQGERWEESGTYKVGVT